MRSPVSTARAGPSSSASARRRLGRRGAPSATQRLEADGRVERLEHGARRRRARRRRRAPRARIARGSARPAGTSAVGRPVAGADVLGERGADDAVDRLGGQLHRSILGSCPRLEDDVAGEGRRPRSGSRSGSGRRGSRAARARSRRRAAAASAAEPRRRSSPSALRITPASSQSARRSSGVDRRLGDGVRRSAPDAARRAPARASAASAARRPKTRHSSSEFDASRFAPWTPVHAHSPAA